MSVIETENRYDSRVYPRRELVLEKGEGEFVWDIEGNRYIDFFGGPAVNLIGYSHSKLSEAICAQTQRLNVCYSMFYNSERARLLKRLAKITPGNLERTFLSNSGSEAVEAALKFARAATGKSEVVACMNSFHGKTLGSLSVTWNPKYRKIFQELIPDTRFVRFGDVNSLRDAITDSTAALILEVVQGEGGVRPAPSGYIEAARELTEENDVLLIVDEIQTGLGRTGKMFACEHSDISPDIMVLGKGLSGGIPVGVTIMDSKIAALPVKSHTSTFGGNPIACRAANTILDIITEENLVEQSRENGNYFANRLSEIAGSKKVVREARGLGLMWALELKEKVSPYVKSAQENGLILGISGSTTMRFLPPLNVSRNSIDVLCNFLEESL